MPYYCVIQRNRNMNKETSYNSLYSIDQIVAIDPGVSGGIAIYTPNTAAKVVKMPTLKEFYNLIIQLKNEIPNTLVVLEKVQIMPHDSKNVGKSMRIGTMTKNYDQMTAALTIAEVAFIEVVPRAWQTALAFQTKGLEKPERKNLYKSFSQVNFPHIKATLWNADALCILEFARRKITYNIKYIVDKLSDENKDLLLASNTSRIF